MALAADLKVSVSVDVPAVIQSIGESMTGGDFGDVRFDPSQLLAIFAEIAPPDLSALAVSVEAVTKGIDVPSGRPPLTAVTGLALTLDRVRAVQSPDLDIGIAAETGLAALLANVERVRGSVESGSLPDLLSLLPGVSARDFTPRLGGAVGGLVALLQVFGALAAFSAISRRLNQSAGTLCSLLDEDRARTSADVLLGRSADDGLVTLIRTADPEDPQTIADAVSGIAAFQQAVLDVSADWSTGMGFGEAALGRLDLEISAIGLETARLLLEQADVGAVAEMSHTVRAALSPALEMTLPDPGAMPAGAIDTGLAMVGRITGVLQAWDPATLRAPVRTILGAALEPLSALSRDLDAVGTELAAAIRSVHGTLDDIDLRPIADTIRRALQPVVDALDVVSAGVDAAAGTLRDLSAAITDAFAPVQAAVEAARATVQGALGSARSHLEALHLKELAERLTEALGSVGQALDSAQLSPYFDAAIEVIDTAATVVDAVPFDLLPMDAQQEVVDVCKPIRSLNLQSIEDELRGELGSIRGSMKADALDVLDAAYAEVVAFLDEIDPGPLLQQLEAEGGPLHLLRAKLDEVNPEALLAPVAAGLAEFRDMLSDLDLDATVVEPLNAAFSPVREALGAIDPAGLLAPVQKQLDTARAAVIDVLHIDSAESALAAAKTRFQEFLDRLDAVAMAKVLDAALPEKLRTPSTNGPGDSFAGLMAGLAQAGGLDADETGIVEAVAWVGGADGAAVVRGLLSAVAECLARLAALIGELDPAPLVGAAQAQRRAIIAALVLHPSESGLRMAGERLLAGPDPSAILGPLVENRRRYLRALGAAAARAATVAASHRSEVNVTAARLREALTPLDAIPARVRALLSALGLASPDQPVRDLIARLLDTAGPQRLIPALVELIDVLRDKASAAVDAVLSPVEEAVGSVRALLSAIDLAPIVAELRALHAQVIESANAVDPAVLLAGVLAHAAETQSRLANFDPLAPVRDVLDAALSTARNVTETARPTVVFAEVVELHAELMRMAEGLDVRALLAPVLAALDGLAVQLDDGFDRTGDALQRLQAVLPDRVSGSSATATVDIGVSLG